MVNTQKMSASNRYAIEVRIKLAPRFRNMANMSEKFYSKIISNE